MGLSLARNTKDFVPKLNVELKSFDGEMLTWIREGALIGAVGGMIIGLILYVMLAFGYLPIQGLESLRFQGSMILFFLVMFASTVFGGSAGALVGIGTPKHNPHQHQGRHRDHNITHQEVHKPTKEKNMENPTSDTFGRVNGSSRDFKHTMEGAGDKLEQMSHDTGKKIGAIASDFVSTTSGYAKAGRDYVKENPATGVAIAAAAGLVLGSVLAMAGRRKH